MADAFGAERSKASMIQQKSLWQLPQAFNF
jgi:hypothetical protein